MIFTLRDATVSDIDSIVNLESISLKHPWTRDDIAALMEPSSGAAGKLAVAAVDDSTGTLAAYIGASCILDECEIGNVCTHPDYRRRGAAYSVIQALITRCKDRDIKKIFLEVSSVNIPAIALYRKIGFEQYNIRRDYYGAGDDALLFVYNL